MKCSVMRGHFETTTSIGRISHLICMKIMLYIFLYGTMKEENPVHTFSRSARSILPANSFRSRSPLEKLAEYFGSVGGGMGRAAMAGLSPDIAGCDLFTL